MKATKYVIKGLDVQALNLYAFKKDVPKVFFGKNFFTNPSEPFANDIKDAYLFTLKKAMKVIKFANTLPNLKQGLFNYYPCES